VACPSGATCASAALPTAALSLLLPGVAGAPALSAVDGGRVLTPLAVPGGSGGSGAWRVGCAAAGGGAALLAGEDGSGAAQGAMWVRSSAAWSATAPLSGLPNGAAPSLCALGVTRGAWLLIDGGGGAQGVYASSGASPLSFSSIAAGGGAAPA
jgi:hypothetical protein